MTSRLPLLRVSVVAGGSRVDLAVPPGLPVAELVPGLARRLGVTSYDGLRLCTLTGSVLDDSAGLAPQDVRDGAVLALAPAPPPPVVHDDAAEALSERASPGELPRWLPVTGAALALVLGAVTCAVAEEVRIAGTLALLLLAVALGLGRVASGKAVVASVAACGYAAVATGLLAADLRPGTGTVWAAAGGAALAVASLAMAALPGDRLRLLPVLVVAATAAGVGAVLAVRPIPLGLLASVLLVLEVLLASGLPWLAVGRISRPRGRVDVAALAGEVQLARELLVGLAVGLAVVHLALVPVVARHGPAGIALAGCASACSLLRARHHSVPVEALPGAVAGGLGLLTSAAAALWWHEPWRPAGAWLLAGAGVVGLVGSQLRARASRAPQRGHGWDVIVGPVLRALESCCLVALLPLLVLTSDVLEWWW
jgi:hypothetical protein